MDARANEAVHDALVAAYSRMIADSLSTHASDAPPVKNLLAAVDYRLRHRTRSPIGAAVRAYAVRTYRGWR